MKPSELFGVFVRTIGLLLIGCSLWNLLSVLLTAPYVSISAGGREVYTWPVALLLIQFLVLAVGALCFFRADWIVRLAYSRRSSPEELPAPEGGRVSTRQ